MNKYRVIFLASVLFSLNIISMDHYYKEWIGQVLIKDQERRKAEQESRSNALEKQPSVVVQRLQDQKGRNARFDNELLMWHELDRREKEEVKK